MNMLKNKVVLIPDKIKQVILYASDQLPLTLTLERKQVTIEISEVTVSLDTTKKILEAGFLHQYRPLENISKDAKLTIIIDGHQISLPSSISSNLLRYLQEPKAIGRFSCIDFINKMFNIKRGLNEFNPLDWNITPLLNRTSYLAPGDMVFITKDLDYMRITPLHFAILLSRGRYLSLFGNAGPLIVTSMHEMIRAFQPLIELNHTLSQGTQGEVLHVFKAVLKTEAFNRTRQIKPQDFTSFMGMGTTQ